MNIIKTNIKDNEWTMDLSYDMFQSPDRTPCKDAVEVPLHVDKFAIYTEENASGTDTRLCTILTDEGKVVVTNSPSFIRTFESIADLAERSNVEHFAISIKKEKSRNNREFITAVYVKD